MWAELLAGLRIHAVVQREFKAFRHVEITGEDVSLLAERADFHAAAAAAGARVFQAFALAQLFLHDSVGVENGRETVALAHDAQRVFKKMIGTFPRKLDVRARLEQVHVLDDFQQEVGNFIGAIRAVAEQAADVDVREIRVGAALGGGHADFRRRRMVVELDKKTFQKFAGALTRERTVSQSLFVKRQQMLIEMAGIERIPAVQFRDDREVTEPIILKRLVEIPRRIRRHARTNFRDAVQFRAALRIAFPRRQFARQRRVPFRKNVDGVARDVKRAQRLAFVERERVVEKIQLGHGVGDVVFEIHHALGINLVVQHRVAGRALLHELRKNSSVVGREPFLRQRGKNLVAQRASAPVGNDLLLVKPDGFVIHAIPRLGPRVENFQILDAVAGEFGKRRHQLGRRAALAHDQFAGTEINRLVLAEVQKGFGAHHRHGKQTGVGLIKFREQHRAFGGNARRSIQALATKFGCADIHGGNYTSLSNNEAS